jgi:hypothetical protein
MIAATIDQPRRAVGAGALRRARHDRQGARRPNLVGSLGGGEPMHRRLAPEVAAIVAAPSRHTEEALV